MDEIYIENLKESINKREFKYVADQVRIAIAILTTALVGVAASFFVLSDSFEFKNRIFQQTDGDQYVSATRIAILQAQMEKLAKAASELSSNESETSLPDDYKMLASDINKLDQRLKKIESAILESPERALSIPLIRKDITDSEKRLEEYRLAGRHDIDRLYEQQKWMLGGIGTALFAMIAGAVSMIYRSITKLKDDKL